MDMKEAIRRTPAPVTSGTVLALGMTLLAVSVVMVASATASLDRGMLGGLPWKTPFGRQCMFAVVGLLVMVLTMYISARMLNSSVARRRLPVMLFLVVLACLAIVLIPGMSDSHRGSQRWLRVGSSSFGLSFQPSETAKLALIVFLASLLGRQGSAPRSFMKGFLPASSAVLLCAGLVGKENLGTAALLVAVGFSLMFVAGCRWHYLLMLGVIGIAGMIVLLRAESYRLERLTSYTNMWNDPQGKGYQPLQSLATITSGGWWGVGLGAGIQKYGYLPESHTDFIFAMICEEMGVLGGAVVIALFCGLIWVGLRIMLAAVSRSEQLLAFGITAVFGIQAAMNIAVVTVVTPTTGISLPLISAGGSGMMVLCAALGMLAAVARRGELQARVDRQPVSATPDQTPVAEPFVSYGV